MYEITVLSARRSDALRPEDADHRWPAGASTTRLWGKTPTALADSPEAQAKFKATEYEICCLKKLNFVVATFVEPCCAPLSMSGSFEFEVASSVGVYDGDCSVSLSRQSLTR